ncbi:MAG: DUF6851 domain-containing protein [Pseudomonadota bacterium]
MTDSIMIDAPLGTSLEELCEIVDGVVAELPTSGLFLGTEEGDVETLSETAIIRTRAGDDTIEVLDDTRTVLTGTGSDDVTLRGSAETVKLNAGDDTLLVEGTVDSVSAGKGNDDITVGDVKSVDLGNGDDILTVEGSVASISAGLGDDAIEVRGEAGVINTSLGNDTVIVAQGAERVLLGNGNDELAVGDLVGFANGGAGFDKLFFDFNAADFDVSVNGRVVTFADRFTGEEMQARGFEEFNFNDARFTLAEVQENFGDDALPFIQVSEGTQAVSVNNADATVSVVWDRVVQEAVINPGGVDVGPTVASRAYAMMHTAMFDAWASFDETAVRVSFDETGNNETLKGDLENTEENKIVAMSFAALTVLSDLFPNRADFFEEVATERFGLDLENPGDAGLVGIDAANDLIALRSNDGSNQAGNYADTTGYQPVNPNPLEINDITKWTPENVPVDPEDENAEQSFLTPQWQEVESFAIAEDEAGNTDFSEIRPVAPQPFFTEAFAGSTLNFDDKTITLDADLTLGEDFFAAGSTIDVSKDLIGSVINEGFITQAEEIVEFSANLNDEEKIIAEFFEDGGGTPFPPGSWMAFGQFVSSRDGNSTDDDAKLFLSLGNAVQDAGIATWEAKIFYDYARPVRAIRDLGELGLIGEEGFDENTGEEGFVIEAFGGFNEDGTGRGTQTILAENFVTFQLPGGNVSPPFAEYTSGHSAFSAAGAEVLKLFTGSDEFGGSVTFEPDSIIFERGVPEVETTLAWETFSEAADEAGLSRLFGGIHFNEGDINGRTLGREVGADAFELAQLFINGEATDEDRPFFTPEVEPELPPAPVPEDLVVA